MSSSYENLRVWQQGKTLAVDMYKLIRQSDLLNKDYGLKDQMQRAAVSIPSNIAEGEVSGTVKNSVRYLHIALGSAAELKTQLIIAQEIGYIPLQVRCDVEHQISDLEVRVRNLIKARL